MHRKIFIFINFIVGARSVDEDTARKEYVFNCMLVSFVVLTGIAFIFSFIRAQFSGTGENVDALPLGVFLIFITLIYAFSRIKFSRVLVYIFILAYLFVGSLSLLSYSYVLPQGLLMYSLLIIVTGILLSSLASFIVYIFMVIFLYVLYFLQTNHYINPYMDELNDPMKTGDLAIFVALFLIMFLVSWLYNKEISQSLEKVRESEELLKEHNSNLEKIIAKRTSELEAAHKSKIDDLYKFAEVGKLTSSLLHDIANPLTAVSLNLDMLGSEKIQKDKLRQLKNSVNYMENYVVSARSQINKESSCRFFDANTEIENVLDFLLHKARVNKVETSFKCKRKCEIYGDCSKFGQLVSNLIANAIDSHNRYDRKEQKIVYISSEVVSKNKKDIYILKVRDNGEGMSSDRLKEIFKPFFTTKAKDMGSGIGLSIVKRVTENDFCGKVYVDSELGKGTEFRIEIPMRVDFIQN